MLTRIVQAIRWSFSPRLSGALGFALGVTLAVSHPLAFTSTWLAASIFLILLTTWSTFACMHGLRLWCDLLLVVEVKAARVVFELVPIFIFFAVCIAYASALLPAIVGVPVLRSLISVSFAAVCIAPTLAILACVRHMQYRSGRDSIVARIVDITNVQRVLSKSQIILVVVLVLLLGAIATATSLVSGVLPQLSLLVGVLALAVTAGLIIGALHRLHHEKAAIVDACFPLPEHDSGDNILVGLEGRRRMMSILTPTATRAIAAVSFAPLIVTVIATLITT